MRRADGEPLLFAKGGEGGTQGSGPLRATVTVMERKSSMSPPEPLAIRPCFAGPLRSRAFWASVHLLRKGRVATADVA